MTHRLALGIVPMLVWAGVASAQPAAAREAGDPGSALALPPAFDRLEKALPPGWSMLATGSELVFRHDKPCYANGRVVTVELRYRLEPRWSAAQVTAGQATNHQVAAEDHALAARYRIAALHGKPPASADDRARLDAYDSEHAKLAKRLVALPHCSTGDVSVFDGEDTYAQLALALDPPAVLAEAHQVIGLVAQHCR